MTVNELLQRMPLWEFEGWRQYYRRNGFAADRLVGTQARGASAICQSWGASISPGEIIPSFGPKRRTLAAIVSYAKTIPGAKVYHYGR